MGRRGRRRAPGEQKNRKKEERENAGLVVDF